MKKEMVRHNKLKSALWALAFLFSTSGNIFAANNVGAFEVSPGGSCPEPVKLIIKANSKLEYGYWITLLHSDEFLLGGKPLWLDPDCYQSELIVHKSHDVADVMSLQDYYRLRKTATFSASFNAIKPRFHKSFDDHKAITIVGHSGGTSGYIAHVLSLNKNISLRSSSIGHYDYGLNLRGFLQVQERVRLH
jgi:hypothetical protein